MKVKAFIYKLNTMGGHHTLIERRDMEVKRHIEPADYRDVDEAYGRYMYSEELRLEAELDGEYGEGYAYSFEW